MVVYRSTTFGSSSRAVRVKGAAVSEAQLPGRARMIAHLTQVLLLVLTTSMAVAAWSSDVTVLQALCLVGGPVLVAVATVMSFGWVGRRRASLANGMPTIAWAVVNVVGVTLLSIGDPGVARAARILALLAALWLASNTRTWSLFVALAAVLISWLAPPTVTGSWPATAEGWVENGAAMLVMVAAVLIMHAVARAVAADESSLIDAMGRRREASARAADIETIEHSILDTIDVAVAVYGPQHELVASNAAADEFARHEGFDLENLVPDTGSFALAYDRATPIPKEERLVWKIHRDEEIDRRLVWLDSAGEQHAYVKTVRLVHRSDDAVIGTMVVATEVTDLLLSQQIRQDFLRTASHELRTPMTSIIGNLDLLEEQLADAGGAVADRLAAIQRNVARLMDRIAELVAAADQRIDLRRTLTDLSPLVTDAVESATRRHPTRTIHWRVTTAPLTALVDPARMTQALLAVLDNAIKFSPDTPAITVELSSLADRAVITVTDHGVGMSPMERAHAFDRFYRTPYAHQQAVPGFGLGLGLGLAQAIVTAHGGTVRLQNPHDDGTTVVIDIPCERATTTS